MTITDVLLNRQVRAVTGWMTLGIGIILLYILGNTFLVPLWWPSMYYWAYILWPVIELILLVVAAFVVSTMLIARQTPRQEPVFQESLRESEFQQQHERATDPVLVTTGQVVAITEETISSY